MTKPLRLLTIIGARPQIIKAAALARAIAGPFKGRIEEKLLHTGQHYDDSMSAVFFDEMGIPPADIQLNVGSGSHGAQTAAMLPGIEEAIVTERPDVVLIYGDTNSTLAGAIAASKLHVPVAHLEAGLRSFNKKMPEEINRIVSDHCSSWLFCPTRTAIRNLEREGFVWKAEGNATMDHPHVHLSGDVMYDNTLHFSSVAEGRSKILSDLGLEKNSFMLATIHRPANTDDPERLRTLLTTLADVAEEWRMPMVLPLHPRTRARLENDPSDSKIHASSLLRLISPAGFLDMTMLEKHARLVFTDSGGVQKEAYFFGRPCIILREETEWVELVEAGMATLADADPERIRTAVSEFMAREDAPREGLFGDGHAAEKVCTALLA
jgi:UDP-GlcNAc3NAcA epimerase